MGPSCGSCSTPRKGWLAGILSLQEVSAAISPASKCGCHLQPHQPHCSHALNCLTLLIIRPATLCLLLIITLRIVGDCSLTACGRCCLACFWQMGQIGGPFKWWLHWAAHFWLYIKSVRQSMTIFFLQRCFQNKFCLSRQYLPWSVLGILCSILWTMVWNLFFDLGPSLCWTCKCAFTAFMIWEMESISAGWQVLRVSGK